MRKILFFLQDLAGGGAERVAVLLANGFHARGNDVHIILVRKQGPFVDSLHPDIGITELTTNRTALSFWELSKIIKTRQPDIILSHLTHVNVSALLAARLAGLHSRTVVVEHNQFNLNYKRITSAMVRISYRLAKYVYPMAGAVVSVSSGVRDVLQNAGNVPSNNGQVVHNPVVHEGLLAKAALLAEHPWFGSKRPAPVIMAVGRLSEQKDFTTFLHAVHHVVKTRDVRAVIFGEGTQRDSLEALRSSLELETIVDMPGFTDNPFAHMAQSDLMVLSSRWEGLPTVLIEGLACGAQIVATDCPSGPNEILDGGRYGHLVPVGDAVALGNSIISALDTSPDIEALKRRADDFSVERSVEHYTALFDRLCEGDL